MAPSLRLSVLSAFLVVLAITGGVRSSDCDAYTDDDGDWQFGFDCPGWLDSRDEYYCCGTSTDKYCCDYDTYQHFGYAAEGLAAAAIVGIVIGVLILVGIIIGIIACVWCCVVAATPRPAHTQVIHAGHVAPQPHVATVSYSTAYAQPPPAYSYGQQTATTVVY